MPPKFKFTREEIIKTALDLTRSEGIDAPHQRSAYPCGREGRAHCAGHRADLRRSAGDGAQHIRTAAGGGIP